MKIVNQSDQDTQEKLMKSPTEIKSDHDSGSKHGKVRYAVLLAAFSSLGGWFFGYDQGVTGGAVVMSSFKNDFCIGLHGNQSMCNLPINGLPGDYRRYLVMYTLLYNVGCFLGAAIISSYIAERLGRRAILFTASILFFIGTCMVIFSPGGSKVFVILILLGRIIEGMGVGCSSFACPLYASEIAPTNLRGMLSAFMQMTIVTGLFLANVVNYVLQDHPLGWRLSNGVILIAPLILMIGIFFCPESPRWLIKKNASQAAERSLHRIRRTTEVTEELEAIVRAIEREDHEISTRQIFSMKKLRQQLYLGIFLHILNQGTGINPIFTFGGMIYESILGKGIISLLILSGVNLLCTIPALFLIDRLGRRKLLILFGFGMVIGHIVAATVFSKGCQVLKMPIGNTAITQDTVSCSPNSGILMLLFTAIFVGFYALSWGAVVWVYVAEIFPLNVRAKSISITTGSNWFMGTIMSYVLELIAPIGIHGVFYMFSGSCLLAVLFVYLLCPETKEILLEDIQDEFEKFYSKTNRQNAKLKGIDKN